MRLLLYSWSANNEQILADNLIKSGFEVIWFHKECKHYTRDMELAMEMIPFIHAQGTEAVVSFNFFPIISMICSTCQIPYYAWVYDCPHFTLYAKQITMPCNHIGIFDRDMVRQLRSYGVSTVYHVPLAVDAAYFGKAVTQASRQEVERYQCDISFVGSLYTGEHNYYDVLFPADQAKRDGMITRETGRTSAKAKMDAVINRQCFSYRKNSLWQAVTDGDIDFSVLQVRMEEQGLMLGEDYFAKPEDILLAAVLEKKITVEERRILLAEIGKRFTCKGCKRYQSDNRGAVRNESDSDSGNGKGNSNSNSNDKGNDNSSGNGGDFSGDWVERRSCIEDECDFRMYTGSDTGELPELNPYHHGTVDYHTQMPLVFAGSKINLNISLRSIHSGIPLRVLDIMACGGFVLSNWQPEIAENFEEGVEIVTFDSLDDCLHKIEYYLTHEEERKRIARNGCRKVQERFSYQIGLEKLFK